jgi:hypothetical protein
MKHCERPACKMWKKRTMSLVGTTAASIWISKLRQPTTNSWPRTRTVAIRCTPVEASLTPYCNRNGAASTSSTKKESLTYEAYPHLENHIWSKHDNTSIPNSQLQDNCSFSTWGIKDFAWWKSLSCWIWDGTKILSSPQSQTRECAKNLGNVVLEFSILFWGKLVTFLVNRVMVVCPDHICWINTSLYQLQPSRNWVRVKSRETCKFTPHPPRK